MSRNIFVYGSLMYEPVWKKIVAGQYHSRVATLTGFQRFAIKGELYPAVIKHEGESVEGLVWERVSDQDIKSLDSFEGEYYSRCTEQVFDAQGNRLNADFYLLNEQFKAILENKAWDKKQFENYYLPIFLKTYFGFSQREQQR